MFELKEHKWNSTYKNEVIKGSSEKLNEEIFENKNYVTLNIVRFLKLSKELKNNLVLYCKFKDN
jgi:hypothetical protein